MPIWKKDQIRIIRPSQSGEGEGQGGSPNRDVTPPTPPPPGKSGGGKSEQEKQQKGQQDQRGESPEDKLPGAPGHARDTTRRDEGWWKKQISQARHAAEMSGQTAGTNALKRVIKNVLESKIDWRAILRNIIKTISNKTTGSWRRPSKRGLSAKVYLPGRVRQKTAEFVIAIDISGSITTFEYAMFVGEIFKMFKDIPDANVKILWWGSTVKAEEDFTPQTYKKVLEHDISQYSEGTEISSVKDYLLHAKYRPELVVYFTDGQVEGDPVFYSGRRIFVVPEKHGTDQILKKHGRVIWIPAKKGVSSEEGE